jgi:hypothetical protein
MNEGAHVCAAMCSSVSTSALRCLHADTNAVAVSTAARVSEATDALEQVRTNVSVLVRAEMCRVRTRLVSLYNAKCSRVHAVDRESDCRRDANKSVTLCASR